MIEDQRQPIQQNQNQKLDKKNKQFEEKFKLKFIINQNDKSLNIQNIDFDWQKQLGSRHKELESIEAICLKSLVFSSKNMAILGSIPFTQVKVLSICHLGEIYASIVHRLQGDGVVQLFSKDKWASLQNLYLVHNLIQDKGANVIFSVNLTKLQSLNIACNEIRANGIINLPKTNLINLKSLELHFNNIRSKGVKLLIKANLPNLEKLTLSTCELGNEGAKHLSKNTWPNLKSIGYNANYIGIDGHIALVQNYWSNLEMFVQLEKCNSRYSYAQFRILMQLEEKLNISHMFFSIWQLEKLLDYRYSYTKNPKIQIMYDVKTEDYQLLLD